MTKDNTELTFVRCPACGSLVPAVSTRCKMCGASLDFEAKKTSEEKTNAKRVRQKTTALTSEDKDSFEEEKAQDEIPLDDPLSAYIEEVEEKDNNSSKEADFDEDFDDFFLDDDEPKKDKKEEASKLKKVEDDLDDFWDDFDDLDDLDEPVKAKETSKNKEMDEFDSITVETGGKKNSKESKLNLKGKSEKQTKKTLAKKAAKPMVKKKIKPSKNAEQPKSSSSVIEISMPEVDTELCAWLVSFVSAKGESFELREGKYFVTQNSIKDKDIVINEKSISAPHAILTVSSDEGISLQDLMSDNGSFYKDPEDDDFEEVEDSVDLEHHSKIRLGNVEFLVVFLKRD